MTSDRWLPVVIFAALVLLIAAPLTVRQVREARRPVLEEARIVTASDFDPVYRTGPRHLGPNEEPAIAVAVRLGLPGGRSRWLAPVDALEIDGALVDHESSNSWPERDRQLRVFWFTVESANVGGTVTPERAAQLLRFRTFLASEMGRGQLAAALPEVHNDDVLGPQPEQITVNAGTLRLYARVEVFDPEREIRTLQSIATAGPEQILDPGYPALHRSVRLGDGIDPAVGELFNLSGWELEGDDTGRWDDIGAAAFGLPFTELVERRMVVSSRTFAAVAASGTASTDGSLAASGAALTVTDGAVTSAGRPLRWGADVRTGDLLVDGSHAAVLVSDDGNATLDAADAVAHCWRRPPAVTTLGAVLAAGSDRIELVRHDP